MPPATDLPIRCSCGALRGVLRNASPANGSHGICYCHDCQACAHFLGRPDEILDPNGGTQIYQTSSASIQWTAGIENIACMRLSEKGLLRWYARCCNTPLGNTFSTPTVPFVGVVLSCVQRPPDDPDLTNTLGPILARMSRQFAKGDTSHFPPDSKSMSGMIMRFVRLMLGWRFRGDHKRSAFFEPATGQPRVALQILTPEERAALAASVTAPAPAGMPSAQDTPAQRA